jgi:enterochelin esterase-like enzyme
MPEGVPATSNHRHAEYPRLHPDGRVTFRVFAPLAQSVAIEPMMGMIENNGHNGLGNAPYAMTRDAEGFWTVTTPTVVPGLHSYFVVIDGMRVNDPSSRAFSSIDRQVSAVEIPEQAADFHVINDVPHGQIHLQWYFSEITGQWRRAVIYTPPDYDTDAGQRFPVLILRHGAGEDETSWTEQGHANFILDNLIYVGGCKPVIAVMDCGYASKPGGPTSPAPFPTPSEVVEVTIKELIPMVDARFRTIPDREHRAMAGVSMGSIQTLEIGLSHLDKFSALGIFSRPPVAFAEFDVHKLSGKSIPEAASFNQAVHLFWWGTGTAEPGIHKSVQAILKDLDEVGIKYEFCQYPGLSHEWQLWRKCLFDFAPRLFQW